MKSIIALIRIHWLTFTSYRMNVVFSLGGLLAMLVPVYLVSSSLQPVVAESIAGEGGAYFGFLVIGLAAMQLIGISVRGLPQAIAGGITSGTLESLFSTPTSLQQLLAGLTGYGILWAVIRSSLLIAGIALFGGTLFWTGVPLAALIVALLVLAHLPFGVLLASGTLVFRTTGPIGPALLGAFTLLGGVYYSTTVIPEVVRPLAALMPTTYGLRALRRVLLSGETLGAVAGDVAVLAVIGGVLLAISMVVFSWSLRYAKRSGTLAQY